MIKGTFHKSCKCASCKAGRSSKAGQAAQKQNERKLRQKSKRMLNEVIKGNADDALIAPISSPYTD